MRELQFTTSMLDSRGFFLIHGLSARRAGAKLRDHCSLCLRKLLIGLLCLPLFAQSTPTSTSAEIEARDQGAKLRALIEAAPKLSFAQTDLVIKLPKGQELGMVSWLARDPKTGVTWLIQRGDKSRSSHCG